MKINYLTILSLLFLQILGCKGQPEYLFLPQSMKLDLTPFLFRVYSPSELATLSNSDFNANESGLITSTKFSRYLSNWSNNRPSGVVGNLVLFQIQTSGSSSGRYVFFDGKQTFAYPIANLPDLLTDTRDDGVLSIDGVVPKGKRFRIFLRSTELIQRLIILYLHRILLHSQIYLQQHLLITLYCIGDFQKKDWLF